MTRAKFAFILMFFCLCAGPAGHADDIILEMSSGSFLNFSADVSDLSLDFSDNSVGTQSNSVTAVYSIQANDVGRLTDLLMVRLDALYSGIDIQAKPGSYTKVSGNASLSPSQPDFVTMTTTDQGLADKIIDEGEGKLVDGTIPVTYRGVLTERQPAGQQLGTILVSFFDN